MAPTPKILAVLLSVLATLSLPGLARASHSFVNWESPHVHPMDLTPDGTKLLAVNTANNRLTVFNLAGGPGPNSTSIPVGLDPVSVRARSNTEAWVVNHISDSVSVVNLLTGNVVRTLATDDEPADVVFAGTPQRAFITCAQTNTVLVVDPSNPLLPPTRLTLQGEEPRALAVSADGSRVYAAIFESGNNTTVLLGGIAIGGAEIPNAVDDATGPYGGLNPPPNLGATFSPPLNPANPPPPAASHIVKKNALGQWMDDNGMDWTDLVSGPNASRSGRVPGWDVADHDVAIIDTATLLVSYVKGLMNLNMALAVQPGTGHLTVVGTDATNDVRFEPNINGRFLRVLLASVDPSLPTSASVKDLNPHLTYATSTVSQTQRERSVGDPRGIAWNAAGSRAYVTGMGSNNVVVLDAAGARLARIPVGEGPTGLVVDEPRGRLYVLNKFGGSVSVVSLGQNVETWRMNFFDPTPHAIKVGRKHLYNTHRTSGLGHVSCGSCHVDGRIDRLAWDLGDPSGDMKSIADQNKGMGNPIIIGAGAPYSDFHPVKGPMTTQTLQDIIGKEPLHWRGDRDGLEEFNPAFMGLQGDDAMLTPTEMQQFKNFLATLTLPPNPFRNLDNSLPTNLPLTGHVTSAKFGPAGLPLPNGNAVNGLAIFRPPRLAFAGALSCTACHTLPTGLGTDMAWDGSAYLPLPAGPNGERHHGLSSLDGGIDPVLKVPQLRNLYKRVGAEYSLATTNHGIGITHNGAVDSLARFVTLPPFFTTSEQEVADLVAFLLSFSGSDLPQGQTGELMEPPGTSSQDTHAAVGQQLTLTGPSFSVLEQSSRLSTFEALADRERVGLVVKGRWEGVARGWTYRGFGLYQSDRASEVVSTQTLQRMAGTGSELTFTVVPAGSQWRIGVDQDEDGALDRDELERGTDPATPKTKE